MLHRLTELVSIVNSEIKSVVKVKQNNLEVENEQKHHLIYGLLKDTQG